MPMRILSGNFRGMPSLFSVGLTTALVSILGLTSAARPTEARIIDIRGRQIASVFHNLPQNPEFVQLLSAAQEKASICPKAITRTLVFHQGDPSFKLLRVQQDCQGHRMEFEIRSCGSYCGGGSEEWTYVDPYAPWNIGYTFTYTGCNTGNCLEEFTCANPVQ
jgi:hypothetical protein